MYLAKKQRILSKLRQRFFEQQNAKMCTLAKIFFFVFFVVLA
jgi:hypothetical protein